MNDDNVFPLRPRTPSRDELMAEFIENDEWCAILAQQIEDLRNEVAMTNNLFRRLLKILRTDL